jgi:toxin-antitoxin system PIN domain toxin
LTLWAFLRIGTNPRIVERPFSGGEPGALISSWLDLPCAGIGEPGERHWEIPRKLMEQGQVTGPLVTDAVLAAIALEHGETLCTTDPDFARFPGLKWRNPLLA